MSWFVVASVFPAESNACTLNRLKPAAKPWVIDHVPAAALNAASSPLSTTRAELGMVLLPLSKTALVFTIAKKTPPPTVDPVPATERSAIRWKSLLLLVAFNPCSASTWLPISSRSPTGPRSTVLGGLVGALQQEAS